MSAAAANKHTITLGGHFSKNRMAGPIAPADVTICSDIDMMSTNADGRFVHKDGTPYSQP